MDVPDSLVEMERASEWEDWPRVLEIGTSLLDSLGPEAAGAVHLFLGRAFFSLGSNAEALEHFTSGLEGPTPPDVEGLDEFAYFAGMAAMTAGDLDRSRSFLRMAADHGETGSWAGGASTRGLAQIETELGNVDEAIARLTTLAGAVNPFTNMLMARALAAKGSAAAARLQLAAMGQLLPEPSTDASQAEMMTSASAWVSAAEIHLELGHVPEAHRALDECRAALDAAGSPAIPALAYMEVFRAAAHRLDGRPEEAERMLNDRTRVEDPPGDLEPIVLRERARIAFDLGDAEHAKERWEQASTAFRAIGYERRASSTLDEIANGPPVARVHPSHSEDLETVLADTPLPDGVIVSLRLPEQETEASRVMASMFELCQQIEDVLTDRGCEYDGWEVGDGTFNFYCYGDPDVIWPAIEPLVAQGSRLGGSAMFRNDGSERTSEIPPSG